MSAVPAARRTKVCLLSPYRWHIPGATLPRIQPIAPTWHQRPFDDLGWLFDFKYDGFRALPLTCPTNKQSPSQWGIVLKAEVIR